VFHAVDSLMCVYATGGGYPESPTIVLLKEGSCFESPGTAEGQPGGLQTALPEGQGGVLE
jgi:hypothetical protein